MGLARRSDSQHFRDQDSSSDSCWLLDLLPYIWCEHSIVMRSPPSIPAEFRLLLGHLHPHWNSVIISEIQFWSIEMVWSFELPQMPCDCKASSNSLSRASCCAWFSATRSSKLALLLLSVATVGSADSRHIWARCTIQTTIQAIPYITNRHVGYV